MLKAIYAYVDAGGDGLDPPVREAILHLKKHGHKPGAAPETSFQGT
jgi:formate dehydrogenase subunit delta